MSYDQDKAMVPEPRMGALDNLNETVIYLHDRLDLLTNRLLNVLREDGPEKSLQDVPTYHAEVERLVGETQRAALRIEHLLDRLVL